MQSKTSSLGESVSTSASREADQSSYGTNVANCSLEKTLQDEDMDVPGIVEEIIEMLLTGLRDTVCLLDMPLLTVWLFLP